jgi:caa(3)-type oxidase subunit IV
MTMSSQTETTHITPLGTYLKVFGALLILTVITVTVSRFNFGEYNLIVAMSIAGLKALLVALIFMHLLYDHKFYMVIFILAIVFLAVFIILTMADTQTRKDIYDYEMQEIQKNAVIYNEADTTDLLQADSLSALQHDSAAAGNHSDEQGH